MHEGMHELARNCRQGTNKPRSQALVRACSQFQSSVTRVQHGKQSDFKDFDTHTHTHTHKTHTHTPCNSFVTRRMSPPTSCSSLHTDTHTRSSFVTRRMSPPTSRSSCGSTCARGVLRMCDSWEWIGSWILCLAAARLRCISFWRCTPRCVCVCMYVQVLVG